MRTWPTTIARNLAVDTARVRRATPVDPGELVDMLGVVSESAEQRAVRGESVAELRRAEQSPRSIDPALPLQLEEARRQAESAFSGFERGPGWFAEVSEVGLVAAGLASLARWLRQQE